MNDNYVITISRQFGSLGRPVAKKLSELLNIEYYDRYIIGKSATQMEMDAEDVKQVEESAQDVYRKMKYPFASPTTKMQDKLFETQKKIILDLAEKESCIIVGRCSDYILRNYKNHVSIYIYAPYYERLRNCIDTLELTSDEAKRTLDEVDKTREAYNKHYTGCSILDITMKDIMIDSSNLGVEGTAEYLADFVKRRFPAFFEGTK
ncbi:MAG: cytidylate kinase-like family protein [Eubacteriales bacterium]|nr:cytidylate kinase-like family protein [Eubacteriales bacterium]